MSKIIEVDSNLIGNDISVLSIDKNKSVNCKIKGIFQVGKKEMYICSQDIKTKKLFMNRFIQKPGDESYLINPLDTVDELENALDIRDEFYEDIDFYDDIEGAIDEFYDNFDEDDEDEDYDDDEDDEDEDYDDEDDDDDDYDDYDEDDFDEDDDEDEDY